MHDDCPGSMPYFLSWAPEIPILGADHSKSGRRGGAFWKKISGRLQWKKNASHLVRKKKFAEGPSLTYSLPINEKIAGLRLDRKKMQALGVEKKKLRHYWGPTLPANIKWSNPKYLLLTLIIAWYGYSF